jgi:hypothetical protein
VEIIGYVGVQVSQDPARLLPNSLSTLGRFFFSELLHYHKIAHVSVDVNVFSMASLARTYQVEIAS